MESFLVKVIACDRVFYDGKCYQVTIPLEDGGKGIMAHHENMVFSIEPGQLRLLLEDGTWQEGVVGAGFCQVVNNRVTIIVDTAEYPEEVDIRRANEAKERAKEQLRQKQSIRNITVHRHHLQERWQDFVTVQKMISMYKNFERYINSKIQALHAWIFVSFGL